MKVLYHANCADGTFAALAMFSKLGEDAEYIPVQYNNPPPPIREGEVVYMVDFSYPRDVIETMAKTAGRVVIIDHHKTAREALSKPFDTPNPVETHFDMEHSGCMLAWRYCHPDKPAPLPFELIEDYDLWRFKHKESEPFATMVKVTQDWKTEMAWVLDDPETDNYSAQLQLHLLGGSAIMRFIHAEGIRLLSEIPMVGSFDGRAAPMFNIHPSMTSKILHMALAYMPEAAFVVGYHLHNGRVTFSLRSRSGSDVDVSEIARANGGGGHKHAAGFTGTEFHVSARPMPEAKNDDEIGFVA